ncbi:unnamed protein product [Cochlearia groenlandica]
MNYSHEDAVRSIIYGHRCAMRLKMRLDDPTAKEDGSVSSYDLAKSIVDCFSNAISKFSDNKVKCEGDNQFLDLSSRDSSSPSSHMTHSKKRKMNNTSPSENWRDDSPDPIHYDGFLWRKYGQKCIKNSVHQRSYYRCSYNKDYDCEARKHEQKIKDNPPVYRTTYFGQHTCKTNHNQEANIFATIDLEPVHDSRMIRFGKDVDNEKKPRLDCVYLPVKLEEDAKNKVAMVQRTLEIDQDCQDLIEENISPSSGSESSELLWENIDSWDFGDLWTDNL